MAKKKKYQITLTFSSHPDSPDLLELKNHILSGKMKRELNEEYLENGKGMKTYSATITEVK